jgi:hypothetical protein
MLGGTMATLDTSTNNAIVTFAQLNAENERRLTRYAAGPFFQMLNEHTLQDARKREALLACMARFSKNFQIILFTRQALCVEPRYGRVFLQHFKEEFGHDEVLFEEAQTKPVQDTLFEAIVCWFNYQMLVLDNAERATLTHMVLETSGDHFWSFALGRLGPYLPSKFVKLHSELDAGHASVAAELLGQESPPTYERLARVVSDGWSMMEAMVERTRQLIEAAV